MVEGRELSLFLEGCELAGRWKLSPPAFEEKEPNKEQLALMQQRTAKLMLGDYAGVVMVDGYAAYQTATKSGADGPASCSLVFCWAHVRRKSAVCH
jgi:hypothetical protein